MALDAVLLQERNDVALEFGGWGGNRKRGDKDEPRSHGIIEGGGSESGGTAASGLISALIRAVFIPGLAALTASVDKRHSAL